MKVPRDKMDPPGKGNYWTLAPGFMDASPEACSKMNTRKRKRRGAQSKENRNELTELKEQTSAAAPTQFDSERTQLDREKSGSQESLIRAALLTPPSSPNDAVYEPQTSGPGQSSLTNPATATPLTPTAINLSENCKRFSIANLLSYIASIFVVCVSCACLCACVSIFPSALFSSLSSLLLYSQE